MTTINTLISDALIDLGKLSASETIEPEDLAHGVRVANRLFGRWATNNLLIPYTTSENFSLSAGTASYTMGSGGTASSTRAIKLIDNCYVSDGLIDYPTRLINQGQYNQIDYKSLGGRPTVLFYDSVYPTGVLYYWRTPDTSYTAYIESVKTLHASFSVGDSVSLSKEYEDFVILGLRNRLAGSFGVPVTAYMMKEYEDAMNDIKVLNLANRSVTMNMPAMFSVSGRTYRIEEGE